MNTKSPLGDFHSSLLIELLGVRMNCPSDGSRALNPLVRECSTGGPVVRRRRISNVKIHLICH